MLRRSRQQRGRSAQCWGRGGTPASSTPGRCRADRCRRRSRRGSSTDRESTSHTAVEVVSTPRLSLGIALALAFALAFALSPNHGSGSCPILSAAQSSTPIPTLSLQPSPAVPSGTLWKVASTARPTRWWRAASSPSHRRRLQDTVYCSLCASLVALRPHQRPACWTWGTPLAAKRERGGNNSAI